MVLIHAQPQSTNEKGTLVEMGRRNLAVAEDAFTSLVGLRGRPTRPIRYEAEPCKDEGVSDEALLRHEHHSNEAPTFGVSWRNGGRSVRSSGHSERSKPPSHKPKALSRNTGGEERSELI